MKGISPRQLPNTDSITATETTPQRYNLEKLKWPPRLVMRGLRCFPH